MPEPLSEIFTIKSLLGATLTLLLGILGFITKEIKADVEHHKEQISEVQQQVSSLKTDIQDKADSILREVTFIRKDLERMEDRMNHK